MKKLLTILALLLTVCTMYIKAEVVYSGDAHNVANWNAKQLPVADFPVLAKANAGDVIAVTVTAVGENTKRITLQNTNWGGLSGLEQYIEATGIYYFVLNESHASEIATNGLIVTGENYTFNKVELLYPKTLWTGEVTDNSGWKQSDGLSGSTIFAGLTDGSPIGVTVSAINDGQTWHQYAIRKSQSENVISGSVSEAKTYVHTLTSQNISELQAANFDITAQYLCVSALCTYVENRYTLSLTNENGSILLEEYYNNSYVETTENNFASGVILRLTASTDVTGAVFSRWTDGTNTITGESTNVNSVSDDVLTITMNSDMSVNALFKTTQTLKTASKVMLGDNYNTAVTIGKDAFTNAESGDVITVNLSSTSNDATIVMKENGGGYATYFAESAYSTALISGQTTFTLNVDNDNLSRLKSYGLWVAGSGYTCGNITILSFGSITADTSDNPTEKRKLSITQPTAGGSIRIGDADSNPNTDTYHDINSTVTLNAVASEGYKLAKWTKDGTDQTGTSTSLEVTMSADVAVTATFGQVYTVTAATNSETMGTVAITNAAEDNKYAQGSTITVTATPKNGYAFEKWTKTENTSWSSTTNPLSIEDLSASWTLTGTFTDATFTAPEGETLLSNTATTMGNYAGDLHISTDTYNTYKVGDVIKVYVKSVTDGAQVAIQNRNTWSAMNSETSLATDATVFSWTVTGAENVEKMNSSGLKITGKNYTAWGVTIIPLPTGVKNLSTGSKKINGSTSVTIPKTMFANAVAGDVITVNVSSVQSGAKYTLKGWNQDEREGDSNKNWSSFAYEQDLATDATSFTCTLTADILNIIQYAGLSIEGGTYTCGNVTLTTAYDVPDAQTHSNPIYTLTVTEPVGGTVTIKKGTETVSAGAFEIDTELTLTATAADGYVFKKWTKDGTALDDTSNPLTITMTADVTMAAVFKGNALTYEERRTLWTSTDGETLSWSDMMAQSTEVGDIVEAGEILIVTAKSVDTSEGHYPKISLRDASGNEIGKIDPLVAGENKLSITSAMATAMANGFKFQGESAVLTKLELYKPTPITALAEEETKTLWLNTSGTTLSWNTIAIERAAEWGAVLEEDERIIISVKSKETGDNVWPTVQLQNDTEKIASTANLLNDMTVPCDITITLTAEMVNKMKNGFSITGDKVTITKAVLYKPTMPEKTVHTLNSTETAISGDVNVTVAAAKFANISAYDVLTVNFSITTSPANLILKGNGEDGGWDYLKEIKFENGETLFALPLTPAMTSNLKKNGLQITGSDYTFKSITIKTAGEIPSDSDDSGDDEEDEISNADASEETKKLFNVLKDLYGKKIVSGVVANVDWNTKEAENVYNWTGKWPALNVYDFINLHASKDVNSAGWVDYSDITTAKNWWKEGGIVGAMWHWQVKANNGTDYTCTPGTAADETSFDASKVYVDGTSENTLAKQQLDQLCGYLKKMQDAGIPVVWRPLHEGSGNVEQYTGGKAWFWWGAKGADAYKKLWQWMYNYMVKTKGLNNLIWVWTSQTNDKDWYPGDAYVDIIGRDNYGATAAKLATEYEALKDDYPNKMITLAECGNSETTEMAKLSSIWDAGSRWSWFMTWYDGAYNDGTSTTHKHADKTWWNDAMAKDYVVTRDQMKELLGQDSGGGSQTGVNITLDDLNEGWSSTYDATTKTITTEGEWAARGWYIGDDRYSDKGSITVKFEAVEFGVTLKMEYTTKDGTSKSVSAGAAAGETEVELDIPSDVKTIEKVYITYQPVGKLKLTSVTVNDKVVDTRTEKTLVEKEAKIADGDIVINRGLFSNAAAKDIIYIYATGLSEASKIALEPADFSGAIDGANWTAFTESPFTLKLTESVLATIKEKGLLVRGENFTFTKATLLTEKDLGNEISDDDGDDDGDNDDDGDSDDDDNSGESGNETVFDKTDGEADLSKMTAQDESTTKVSYNEKTGELTITTTEPYKAAQIWFNTPEEVNGNVLEVEIAESSVDVTVTVGYTDGSESSKSSNVARTREAEAATRAAGGTTINVPLESGKQIQKIEVKNARKGTITVRSMTMTYQNVFKNYKADLSMLKPQSGATYDVSTYTLATTKGWTGVTVSPLNDETVKGAELVIRFADAAKVKVAVKYRTDVEGPSIIMEEPNSILRLALDKSKAIQEIMIQPTEAAILTFTEIAVYPAKGMGGLLSEGKTLEVWSGNESLTWNEIAHQSASITSELQEFDEILVTVSSKAEGNDWPKVFLRDTNSEMVGKEVLLNEVTSFPYVVRFVLSKEMVEQLKNGFCICGDGVTVNKVEIYRPYAPKKGDIHVRALDYGYHSTYDAATYTITTSQRWAARGWEIGDNRYNTKDMIVVQFETVDFPVTLKMEYVDAYGQKQATSAGVAGGNTEVRLAIPNGIKQIDKVYITYQTPADLTLIDASVISATQAHARGISEDSRGISIRDRLNGSSGRSAKSTDDNWYNLNGQRITKPTANGVYIHKGKTVVIH